MRNFSDKCMAYFGGDNYYSSVKPRFDHNNSTGRLTNVFTLYDTLVNSTSEAVSGLFLIAIISCAIEEAVAYRKSRFDCLFEQSQCVSGVRGYFNSTSLTSAQVVRST